MDINKPLGVLTSCTKCGGANAWTGKERQTPWEAPAFAQVLEAAAMDSMAGTAVHGFLS